MKHTLTNQRPPHPAPCQGCIQSDCQPKKCDQCADCTEPVTINFNFLAILIGIVIALLIYHSKNY